MFSILNLSETLEMVIKIRQDSEKVLNKTILLHLINLDVNKNTYFTSWDKWEKEDDLCQGREGMPPSLL